ncbi:hypothetical protein [Mucilaginibacter flavus]|uniref:hypothetical protein n=1 Tax=Mucilaginibacter flavus TaxID=931504 RepID=UPI0025B2A7C5|nr:hypothetical protein [Mucilaginibacter flavus]MDN3585030.1 hypothetical protein [Mucilaginibacter flavus]
MYKDLIYSFKYLVAMVFSIASFTGLAQSKQYLVSKMSIFISLKKDSVLSPKEVLIHFEIINKSNVIQKVLLDNPGLLTFGPWTTSAQLIGLKNGKSLQYSSRSSMNSHLSYEDELQGKFRNLFVGGSLATTYKLKDIVAFFNADEDHPLPKGWYLLQLFYGDAASNKVKFYVTR